MDERVDCVDSKLKFHRMRGSAEKSSKILRHYRFNLFRVDETQVRAGVTVAAAANAVDNLFTPLAFAESQTLTEAVNKLRN